MTDMRGLQESMGTALRIKNLPFFVGTFDEVKSVIIRRMKCKKSYVVLPCDLHNIAATSTSQSLLKQYKCIDMCTADGAPLVWWSSAQTKRRIDRVYGPDLMKSILADTQASRLRHAFCGSTVERLPKFMKALRALNPKLTIVAATAPRIGKFQTKEELKALKYLHNNKPDVLWIGMSSPKQVVLSARWKKHFPHTVILCVGAAFDYLTGNAHTAPKLIQTIGLQWAFRLIMEPQRLFKRSIITSPRFILSDIITRIKKFGLLRG